MLDYHLADLSEIYGSDKYPKSAQAYLENWINIKGAIYVGTYPCRAIALNAIYCLMWRRRCAG
ncbi:hypothetical protein AB4187_05705 [Vibrio breoganii]